MIGPVRSVGVFFPVQVIHLLRKRNGEREVSSFLGPQKTLVNLETIGYTLIRWKVLRCQNKETLILRVLWFLTEYFNQTPYLCHSLHRPFRRTWRSENFNSCNNEVILFNCILIFLCLVIHLYVSHIESGPILFRSKENTFIDYYKRDFSHRSTVCYSIDLVTVSLMGFMVYSFHEKVISQRYCNFHLLSFWGSLTKNLFYQ